MDKNSDPRTARMLAWLGEAGAPLGLCADSPCEPASTDAGFRRYFRVTGKDGATFIVMDAPPEHGGMEPFVRVTELMHEAGLHAPKIFASDLKEGFLLLSDLGRETYLNVLNEENAFSLMDDATTALVAWQKISRPGMFLETKTKLPSSDGNPSIPSGCFSRYSL